MTQHSANHAQISPRISIFSAGWESGPWIPYEWKSQTVGASVAHRLCISKGRMHLFWIWPKVKHSTCAPLDVLENLPDEFFIFPETGPPKVPERVWRLLCWVVDLLLWHDQHATPSRSWFIQVIAWTRSWKFLWHFQGWKLEVSWEPKIRPVCGP